jgi:hypothetical protein
LSQGKTKSLPFNWEKFFVPSKTECFLACFAMSARYWASYFPELNLPTDLETWKEFAATSFVEYRGTSIREMIRKIPKKPTEQTVSDNENLNLDIIDSETKQLLELVIKTNTPKGLESLSPFFEVKPPIPQILAYDRLLMTHNISESTGHAVLLHSIDFQKEKLFVVDPMKHQLQEPDVYDFNLFKRAWSECRNLQIITYPKGMITLVSGPVVGIVKQQEISSYFEGEE